MGNLRPKSVGGNRQGFANGFVNGVVTTIQANSYQSNALLDTGISKGYILVQDKYDNIDDFIDNIYQNTGYKVIKVDAGKEGYYHLCMTSARDESVGNKIAASAFKGAMDTMGVNIGLGKHKEYFVDAYGGRGYCNVDVGDLIRAFDTDKMFGYATFTHVFSEQTASVLGAKDDYVQFDQIAVTNECSIFGANQRMTIQTDNEGIPTINVLYFRNYWQFDRMYSTTMW